MKNPRRPMQASQQPANRVRPYLDRSLILFLSLAAGLGLANFMRAPLLAVALAFVLALAARKTRLKTASATLAFLALGIAVGGHRITVAPRGPLYEKVASERGRCALWLRGNVESSASALEGSRVVLRVYSYQNEGSWAADSARVRAVLPVPPPTEGSPFEASIILQLPRESTNPGQYDTEERLSREGVALTGVCRDEALFRLSPPPKTALLARYRAAVRQALVRDAGDQAGIVLAVLIGDRGLLEPRAQEALGRSGLYHLVALSGLHIALLVLLLSFFAHLAGITPLWRDVTCLAVVVLYGMVAGPIPSLSRAIFMASIFLAARMADRPQPALRAWIISLAFLLLWDPQWIFDAGFQLTYAATLGMLLLGTRMSAFMPKEGRLGGLLRILWLGFAAQLFTLPFLVWTFHRIAWAGVLATPFATIPLFMLLGTGLVYLAGGAFVPGLHAVLGAVLAFAGKVFLWLPVTLGEMRHGAVFMPVPWGGWLIFYCAALVLLPVKGRRALAGWAAICAVMVCAWAFPRPFDVPKGPAVVVLDVGQASCQAVVSQGECVLVDCGNGIYLGPTSGRVVVEPFLAEAGLRRVTGVFLTHWDSDHSAGLMDLLRDLPVGFLAYPAADPPGTGTPSLITALAKRAGVRLLPVSRGDAFKALNLSWRVLHPANEFLPNENDRSLVLMGDSGRASFLWSGDLEASGEKELLAQGNAFAVDGMMAPHHGAGTSNTREFIEAFRPESVFFSVGTANRYGHPSPEIVARYRAFGAREYRTDSDGAILFPLDASHAKALAWRGENWLSKLCEPSSPFSVQGGPQGRRGER